MIYHAHRSLVGFFLPSLEDIFRTRQDNLHGPHPALPPLVFPPAIQQTIPGSEGSCFQAAEQFYAKSLSSTGTLTNEPVVV